MGLLLGEELVPLPHTKLEEPVPGPAELSQEAKAPVPTPAMVVDWG
jgi:hypothetical protein